MKKRKIAPRRDEACGARSNIGASLGKTPLLKPDRPDQRHQFVIAALHKPWPHNLIGRSKVAGPEATANPRRRTC